MYGSLSCQSISSVSFEYIVLTSLIFFFFFFNDTATTEIYTLSLHDALPISSSTSRKWRVEVASVWVMQSGDLRSEEHTSELQSQSNLVCRLLLEKKKKTIRPGMPD